MCVVEGDLKGGGHSDCVRVLVEGDPVTLLPCGLKF